MTDNQARCLRHAARWAAALRVQELCDRQSSGGVRPLNEPHLFGTVCRGGRLTPLWRYPVELGACDLTDPGDPDADTMNSFLKERAGRRSDGRQPEGRCPVVP